MVTRKIAEANRGIREEFKRKYLGHIAWNFENTVASRVSSDGHFGFGNRRYLLLPQVDNVSLSNCLHSLLQAIQSVLNMGV